MNDNRRFEKSSCNHAYRNHGGQYNRLQIYYKEVRIMAKKQTYNQMLIGEGFNFGQRMNMIRVKRRKEKKARSDFELGYEPV